MKVEEKKRRIGAAEKRIAEHRERQAKAQAVVDEAKAQIAYEERALEWLRKMPVESEPTEVPASGDA